MSLSTSPSTDDLYALAPRRIGPVWLEDRLGKGGIGEVYRGFHERLKRPVAVKVLANRFASDSRAVGRFVREARLLSRLDHPSICRVYDLVEHAGQHFLILELIEGTTLRRHVDEHPPDEERVLAMAEQILAAVEAAHQQGIVHRDLKPENIMITPEGKVKVLDFGLARTVELPPGSGAVEGLDSGSWEGLPAALASSVTDAPQASANAGPVTQDGDATERYPRSNHPGNANRAAARTTFLTDAGETFGTLTYMSPEQVMQEPVTPKSDLYSFGIILQELATGRRAYPKLDMLHLLDRVQKADVLPAVGVDPDLADLIEALIDREPSERPTSTEALDRIRWLLARPERRRGQRRRWSTGALAAVLASAAALGTALLTHDRNIRQGEIAQRFARAAGDLQWQTREELRAPPHDLRPGREQVRLRMESLRRQMESLGPMARGPAEVALGQAALAMGEWQLGRRHLESAWQQDYRPVEAAIGLGSALFEQYRSELDAIAVLGDEKTRLRRKAELDQRLRDPALAYLEAARRVLAERPDDFVPRSAGESLAYVEALIAFSDGRFDDALVAAERAIEALPWLHEARLLQGRVHRLKGARSESTSKADELEQAYSSARSAFLDAAEIGRSDPSVYLALCELAAAWMRHRIYGPGGDLRILFEQGREACQQARLLDPDDSRPWRLTTDLRMRIAEAEEAAAPKLAELRRAEQSADAAIAIGSTDYRETGRIWRSLGNVYSVEVDWLLYQQDGNVTDPLLRQLTLAYRMAARFAPRDARAHNALGNAFHMVGEIRLPDQRSAERALLRSIRAYRRSLELDADPMVTINMTSALEVHARLRLDRGLEVLPEIREAVVSIDRALVDRPSYAVGWTTRALLCALAADATDRAGRDPETHIEAMSRSFERAMELDPDEEPFLQPALVRIALVRFARASYDGDGGGDSEAEQQAIAHIRDLIEKVREVYPRQADASKARLEALMLEHAAERSGVRG